MRVHYSRMARRDLAMIGEYIFERTPARALPFIESLETRCKLIGEFPEAAPRIEGATGNARMVHHRGYLILYRVAGGEVRISRVWHSARDRSAVFRDMDAEG